MICVIAATQMFAVCTRVVIYFPAYVRKRNRCEHLHRSALQPPPTARSRLQSCFFFFPGQMGCSSYTQSAHTLPNTRCALPLPCSRPLEVMVNCDSERKKNKQTNKKKNATHTHTLTSPIIHHVITVSIHPSNHLSQIWSRQQVV